MCQQWGVDGRRDLRRRHGAWQTWAHDRCHRGATGEERAKIMLYNMHNLANYIYIYI